MTITELEQRLLSLEQAVQHLQKEPGAKDRSARRWWVEQAGRFADDPVFEEIVRLGREYRQSLRPKNTKGKHGHP